MWIPITLIVSLSVSVLLPWIIFSSITENGRIRKGELICRCPTAFRMLLLIGVLMFSCFVLFSLKNDAKGIEIVLLVVMVVSDFIFIVPYYICMRYKIVMDIEKQKIIVYRLCMLKKTIHFSKIFKMEGNELEIVKDNDNKKLFYYSKYMAGGGCLSNCLKIIIRNNQKNESIDIMELRRMFENENHDVKRKLS